jgi:hypothetical protein
MAWSYSAGVLTSTGATEASPDSVLAGIAIVQAADSTKGYRNGLVAWLNDVQIAHAGSWIIFDKDSTVDLRGSSFIVAAGGSVIHDSRSTLLLSTSTLRFNGFTSGSLICRREFANDPNPRIIKRESARNDYPSHEGYAGAIIDIAGLDIYDAATADSFCRMYYGAGATVRKLQNVRLFTNVRVNPQFYLSTYNDFYFQILALEHASAGAVSTFNRPTYYRASPVAFTGAIRSGDITLNNPTFLSSCWNGQINFNSVAAATKLSIQYSLTNTFKIGLTALQNVNVRLTRAIQSQLNSPSWSPPANGTITATTDSAGKYASVYLLDAYHEGATANTIERYNWTAKARGYDYRTPGETYFTNRVMYAGDVNLSQGYSEEVQMLAVSGLTLTKSEAAALTGIAFVASGSTSGTVTISTNHTASNVWAAYRNWISQIANFGSNDSWVLSGAELNLGAWNVVINNAAFTGDMTTTGVITLANGATFNGTRTDANGTVAPPKTVSITGITAGSRIQIYNVTTDTEIVNTVVAGTSYSTTYTEGAGYTTGDTVRVRLAYAASSVAKLPYTAQAIAGASGWAIFASQQSDDVYASFGIDGATVTEYVADFPNVQIDINDADGSTRVDRLYAWFVYTQASNADGIRHWFGGIVPEDEANFKIVTSVLNLKIDNASATGVTFVDGRRLYRDDGASPLVNSTTGGGSITMFAGKVYTSVVSTASPVITGDISTVLAAVGTPMQASSYVSPPTTTAIATSVRAEVQDELTKIEELHAIAGLDPASPMTVTKTSRGAGSISLVITGDGVNTTTVTRT